MKSIRNRLTLQGFCTERCFDIMKSLDFCHMLPIRIVCLLFLTGMLTGSNPMAQIRKMPDFQFKRMSDGAPLTRKALQPSLKTLFVFFDTECPHCMQALSTWNENHASLDGLNTVLLTMDPPMAAIPFLNRYADKILYKKRVLTGIDTDRQFIARFLPRKFPSMFLFSEKGDLLLYSDEEKDIPSLIRLIRKK